MNSIGVQPADVVIEPDVAGFSLSEFSRAHELAAIGKAAANEAIPKIRDLLRQVDADLFQSIDSRPITISSDWMGHSRPTGK